MSARSRNRSNPTGLIIGGIVIIAVALYMIAMGYLDDKKVASLKARCTENTIATVENVTSQTRTRVRHRRHRTVRETYTEYTSYITYSVGDNAYAITEVRTSNDFQKGQQVSIQYDPKDPDIYYLFKPGDGKKFKTALMMSAFMGVIGLLLLIAGISQKPKTKTLKKNKGMTFEQWQEQQLQKEQQLQQSGIDSVDTSVSMDESAYRGTLNETNDYMDSI